MSSFENFITQNGERALKEILAEIGQQNAVVKEREAYKRKKHPERSLDHRIDNLIDPHQISANYQVLFNEVKAAICKTVPNPTLR
jgi:hypothetical protein